VTGRLVELDPANTAAAARRAQDAGLHRIQIVTADASTTDAYVGALPADLVLACGGFGNIRDDGVRRMIQRLPRFCARGATVIWTRHRGVPDLTPLVWEWFESAGFTELPFESTQAPAPDPYGFPIQSIGTHIWDHDPVPLERGIRLLTFLH
jgi:hypothetical protein